MSQTRGAPGTKKLSSGGRVGWLGLGEALLAATESLKLTFFDYIADFFMYDFDPMGANSLNSRGIY